MAANALKKYVNDIRAQLICPYCRKQSEALIGRFLPSGAVFKCKFCGAQDFLECWRTPSAGAGTGAPQ